MRTLLALALFGLLAGAAAPGVVLADAEPGTTIRSGPGEPAYIVPAESPVRFTGFDEQGTLRFSGRFVLSGTYEYGYNLRDTSAAATQLDMHFYVDAASAAMLPHAEAYGPITELDFTNWDAFIVAVVPEADRDAVATRKVRSIRGKASVWVENYNTQVLCDHQNTYATFDAVYQPQVARRDDRFLTWEGC